MCNIAALVAVLLLFHFMHDQFMLYGENFLVNRLAYAYARIFVAVVRSVVLISF